MSTFGAWVRAQRLTARFTQAELGERAGVSERAISDIERGLRRGVYAVTASRLADALGLPPADRDGFLEAARGRERVRAAPTAAPELAALRRTPIVGRAREVEAVRVAMEEAATRLLTITGPGGIGKTRVAAEAWAQTDTADAGRVVFVPLAAVRNPELLLPTVAAAVGLAEPGESVEEDLTRHLAGRRCVLLLDTFEPLLECAPMLGRLLDRVSDLTLVVTSRAPMRIRGERELPLGPLPPAEAERLFVDRARAVRPDLELEGEAREVVAALCDRLAGVPLAVELAAAMVRHMSLPALRSQLDGHPLRVLTEGDRDLPPRQRSMQATIAWSHDLLAEPARLAFRRLACFAGGWTLDAAEAVCTDPGDAETDVLQALEALAEHGLILVEREAATPRWRLLDPIADYAADLLAGAGEADRVASRHAAFYAGLAERAEPHLRMGTQSAWRQALRRESGNLRAALQWTIQGGQAETALRLVAALWMFWRLEGAFGEGCTWMDRALTLDVDGASPHRARALWGAAWLAYHQAAYERAAALGRELEQWAGPTGASLDRRNALTVLGKVAEAEGRVSDAVACFEQALEICQALGPGWHLATSLLNLGTAEMGRGNVARAEGLLEQGRALYEQEGDEHFAARARVELGYAALTANRLDRAAERMIVGLDRFVDLDDRWGVAEALDGLAALAAARGQADAAGRLRGAAQSAYASIGLRALAADTRIGAELLERARATAGERAWRRAIELGRGLSAADTVALARAVARGVPRSSEEGRKPSR